MTTRQQQILISLIQNAGDCRDTNYSCTECPCEALCTIIEKRMYRTEERFPIILSNVLRLYARHYGNEALKQLLVEILI